MKTSSLTGGGEVLDYETASNSESGGDSGGEDSGSEDSDLEVKTLKIFPF